MDQDRFDRIARLLAAAGTRRDGLRAALGGLLGMGLAAVAVDADANSRRGDDAGAGRRRRRKTCKPACVNGFECVKVGRKRVCQCLTGDLCGDACCLVGQTCRDGQCATTPEPGQCIAAGEPCKSVGLPCCDGRTCSSGQGGQDDIACYSPKTGPCQATGDCVYGMLCQNGRCAPPPPVDGLGVACDAAAQQLCASPGAICAAYTGTDAPGGTYCTLPLQKVCTGNPQCTCYTCWYTSATVQGGARGRGESRASSNTMACCHPAGRACAVEQDCCLGLTCVNGTCGGTICVPDDNSGCGPDMPCCNSSATCTAGACLTCGPSTCASGCCSGGVCGTLSTSHVANYSTTRTGMTWVGFLPDGRMVTTSSNAQAPRSVLVWNYQGNAWVQDTGSGGYFVPFPSNNFAQPDALTVTVDGTVLVTDSSNGGNVISAWKEVSSAWQSQGTITGLNRPGQITLAGGLLYVADQYADRIAIFTGSGGSWSLSDSFSTGAGSYPYSVAVADNGDVYAGSNFYSGIKIWRKTGGTWSQVGSTIFPTTYYPGSLTFRGDLLIVAQSPNASAPLVNTVTAIRNVGGTWTEVASLGSGTGSGATQLNGPWSAMVGPGGDIYVSDNQNSRVSIWSLTCPD